MPHSDDFLAALFNSRRGERVDCDIHPAEFTTRDLLGRTLIGVRGIDTGSKHDNPRAIVSWDYNDGSSLLIGVHGDGESGYYHFFLVDARGQDRYASGLNIFDPGFHLP